MLGQSIPSDQSHQLAHHALISPHPCAGLTLVHRHATTSTRDARTRRSRRAPKRKMGLDSGDEAPYFFCVCAPVRGSRTTFKDDDNEKIMQSSQIWDTKRALHEAPKSSSSRTRLRCDSVSAGAATQHIAPPTRAPAGCGPTDARHSRHARSRSHHGHRAATVTPESLQAAGKLPCATTLSSLDAAVVTRRRRRVTSFAFPSRGAPTGASLHLRLPLRRPGAECADSRLSTRLHLRHRLRRLRPALPASSAHLRRDVQLGFRRRLRRRRPQLGVPPGPGPTARGPGHRHSHITGIKVTVCVHVTVHDRV